MWLVVLLIQNFSVIYVDQEPWLVSPFVRYLLEKDSSFSPIFNVRVQRLYFKGKSFNHKVILLVPELMLLQNVVRFTVLTLKLQQSEKFLLVMSMLVIEKWSHAMMELIFQIFRVFSDPVLIKRDERTFEPFNQLWVHPLLLEVVLLQHNCVDAAILLDDELVLVSDLGKLHEKLTEVLLKHLFLFDTILVGAGNQDVFFFLLEVNQIVFVLVLALVNVLLFVHLGVFQEHVLQRLTEVYVSYVLIQLKERLGSVGLIFQVKNKLSNFSEVVEEEDCFEVVWTERKVYNFVLNAFSLSKEVIALMRLFGDAHVHSGLLICF